MSNQENISKETKKTRRKRSQRKSQQIKLAVIMIMVSVLVLSASTFAWYQLNNTAKITNMQFKADTLGNLQLSWNENEGYSNILDLSTGDPSGNRTLLPATAVVTTGNGIAFYEPKYDGDGNEVINVNELKETNSDFSKYVYKKEFYVKSGDTESANTYKLMLNTGNIVGETGTFFKQKLDQGEDSTGYAATNAVRIAFKFENNAMFVSGDKNNCVSVYEPYTGNNSGDGTSAGKTAVDTTSYGPKQYAGVTIKQESDGKFGTHYLCRFTEGKAVKVTMYVWIEGNDDDCDNEIALDDIIGQIQFIAEPVADNASTEVVSSEEPDQGN